MFDSGIKGSGKKFFRLIGRGGCGDIPVTGQPAQYTVPDTATHRIGLKTCCRQGLYDSLHFIRQLYLHILSSF